LGTFDIDELSKVSLEKYIQMFNQGHYHRFNDTAASDFYYAVQKIKNDYEGNARKIWEGNPSSAKVVSRFLEFKGMGIKIATMATNILARQFKIPMSDYYSIDISPDVHVQRILKRLGYLSENATIDQVIYKAREINPEFPGLIDFSCWKIGRENCHPTNPECESCPLKKECKYFISMRG
jgi:endonuclease III